MRVIVQARKNCLIRGIAIAAEYGPTRPYLNKLVVKMVIGLGRVYEFQAEFKAVYGTKILVGAIFAACTVLD